MRWLLGPLIPAVLAGLLLAGCGGQSPARPKVPDGRLLGRPTRSVPNADAASRVCSPTSQIRIVSPHPGATSELVPLGATSLSLCRYEGANATRRDADFGLTAIGVTNERRWIAHVSSALDALEPATGTYSCPMDDGSALLAFFDYRSGGGDTLQIGLSGCQAITNGHLTRLGLGAAVIERLLGLTTPLEPHVATFAGSMRECGGSAPGTCRTARHWRACARGKCSAVDLVVADSTDGRYAAMGDVVRGRFHVNVALPGRYTLKLMAVNDVVASVRATAHLGHTTRVTFKLQIF